jgi:hypothetical protein
MKMIGIFLVGAAGLILAPAFAKAADATTTPAMKCADLVGLTLPETDLKINKAVAVPESPPHTVVIQPPQPTTVAVAVPSHCRIDGSFERRIGAGGKAYTFGIAIALPDKWNGRFLYQGGGGLNGTVQPPLGAAAAGDTPALARGFAVVSTDSGHKGAVFDPSFFADQQATLNFADASVRKVAPVAKEIVARYYGKPAAHSYFAGCSTGGREGMLASERVPGEFDGIVSGDPAMNTGHSNLGLAWFNHQFTRIAPKDASGKPEPKKAFSPREQQLVVDAILKSCDAADGVADGMIFNAKQCRFDPSVLQCKGAKDDSCLAAPQVEALKTAFAGPKTSRGAPGYPAFPYDAGITLKGFIPGILASAGSGPINPPFMETIDVDKIADRVDSDAVERLSNTSRWTNLGTFFGRGGKILYYHGWSDPWFSALDTLDYYQRMAAASGGLDKVRAQSSRFYIVPGMGHCRGGPSLDNFDLLGAVVDWVEKGTAPNYVVATGAAFPKRARPLCAWPLHAQYKGAGNPDDAANFTCEP